MSERRRERKVVTVLSADLVGFTARAETFRTTSPLMRRPDTLFTRGRNSSAELGRVADQVPERPPLAVYDPIAPTFKRLATRVDPDPSRPSIEFYRWRDVIDLQLPVS